MKDMVTVTCYGETREMERADAIRNFVECMVCSDGSELRRYTKIYLQLKQGCRVCSDEEL